MSRITGTDAANLIEAYNSVYASQEEVELTEEQVQEDFENWVNSLVEEGHDLSEYTWEDMYEAYVNEDLIGDLRANAGKAVSAVRSGVSAANRAAGAVNQAMVNRIKQNVPQGSFPGTRQTTTPKPTPSRTFGSDSGGSTGYGRYGQATQLITRPSAPAAPATRPPAAPTAPATRPTAPVSQRPAPSPAAPARPTTPAAPAATTPAAPARTFNPLMQRTFGYQTGNAPDQIAKASQGTSQATSDAAFKRSREMVNKMRSTPTLSQSFDIFDIVKGYLIDEGYAESEEAAAVIMANMSEEWREEIIDEELTGKRKTRAVKKFNSQNENPGNPDTNLAAVATMRHGSRSVKNGNSNIYPADTSDTGNRPTKRGGSGVKGKAKTGYYDGGDELDRGSGNAARRRMENK